MGRWRLSTKSTPTVSLHERGRDVASWHIALSHWSRLTAAAGREIDVDDRGCHIASCFYHRRDAELAELQAVLAGSAKFADLPPRV